MMYQQEKAPSLVLVIMSFLLALMLSILPLPESVQAFRPEWLVLVVIYWTMMLPQRVGIGVAWLLGLLLDALTGAVLGQHALAMTLVAALVRKSQRQLCGMPLWLQSLCVLFLILLYRLVILVVQGMLAPDLPRQWFWIPAVISTLCWPLLLWLFHGKKMQQRIY